MNRLDFKNWFGAYKHSSRSLWEQDEWFYNKKHLQQEINNKLNSTLLKGHNPHNLHYVTIDDDKDGAEIYIGDYGDIPKEIRQKLIPATKYFLGELGVKFREERPDPHDSKIMIIPIEDYPRYEPEPGQWSHLAKENPYAHQKLQSGEVIDVADLGIEIEPGVWKLSKFIDGASYYDSKNQRWIWSIGRDRASGEIFASADGRFYDPHNEDFPFETLWLK